MREFTSIERIYECFLNSTGVTTDSRKICADVFFVALKGDKFDGNKFVIKAIGDGAAWAMTDDESVAEECDRALFVADCLKSLQQLANYHRVKLNTPIIAISGSNGKTTTKELVSRVLGVKYKLVVTQGNLNNHIGVPLTLLRLKADTQLAVVEMGANHQKEIELLCSIAQPNCGVLTNIGRAHLEGFGGEEGVKKGKGELFDYLNNNQGVIFYNANNKIVTEVAEARECAIKVPYDDRNLTDISADSQGFLLLNYLRQPIHTRMIGDYNRFNVITAIAIGDFFGISTDEAITAIEGYEPDNNRSQRIITQCNTIIADLYNANPSSMEAAICNFADIDKSKRKVLILGDMMELGEYSNEEHSRIDALVKKLGFGDVIYVGRNFLATPNIANAKRFNDVNELQSYLGTHKIKDSELLLKGSRSIGLERLLEVL